MRTFSGLQQLAFALGLALTLAACAPARPAAHAAVAGAHAASGDASYSVYDLGSTWTDQTGAARSLRALAGRPQVLAMIYTHCSTTCPLTVADMKRIEQQVPEIGFVLVSLDPARDSSAQLAAFARERGLDSRRWTLLAGHEENVRELAAILSLRYRRLSAAELAHSNTLTLLDSSGAVAYQQSDDGGIETIVAAARALGR